MFGPTTSMPASRRSAASWSPLRCSSTRSRRLGHWSAPRRSAREWGPHVEGALQGRVKLGWNFTRLSHKESRRFGVYRTVVVGSRGAKKGAGRGHGAIEPGLRRRRQPPAPGQGGMNFPPPLLSLRSGRATPSLRCETTTARTNRQGFHLTIADHCPDDRCPHPDTKTSKFLIDDRSKVGLTCHLSRPPRQLDCLWPN